MDSALPTRLRPYTATIFGEMSALATQLGAVNLGQGFPDTDGPAELLRRAADDIVRGVGNQYPPAYRQLLVENGILNADFTPDEDTAAALGWTLREPEEDLE